MTLAEWAVAMTPGGWIDLVQSIAILALVVAVVRLRNAAES